MDKYLMPTAKPPSLGFVVVNWAEDVAGWEKLIISKIVHPNPFIHILDLLY